MRAPFSVALAVAVAAVALVGLVILGHGVRAVLIGWIPSGDDGYWSIMARSVFSSRPPLLGSSSSGGASPRRPSIPLPPPRYRHGA